MSDFWIVIADAARAVIFSKTKEDRRTTLLHRLENPMGRYHTSEMVTDRRTGLEKKSGTHSASEPHTDPHEQQAVNFAHHLGQLLDEAAGGQEFERLILVAPPHFLGLLRSRLGRVSKRRLARCEAKEFAHANLEQLEQCVDEVAHLAEFSDNATL